MKETIDILYIYHSQNLGYTPKLLGEKKKQENITYTQEKRQLVETSPKMHQMLKLAEKDFKSSIITTLMEIKENTVLMNK